MGWRRAFGATAALLAAAVACGGSGPSSYDPDHPALRDEADPGRDAGASETAATGPAVSEAEVPAEPAAAHFRRPPEVVLAAIGQIGSDACADVTPDRCAVRGTEHEYGNGGRARDAQEAARHYQSACAAGSALGCSNLAGMLRTGKLGAGGLARALQLYDYACSAGQLTACHKLAFARAAGCEGAPESPLCNAEVVTPSQGRSVLDNACKAGQWSACTSLGSYSEGDERTRLYRLACDNGDSLGCHNLADETADGDPDKLALHQRACGDQLASSCMKAGMLLSATDEQAARTLIDEACQLGEPRACWTLDMLEK